MRKFMHSQKGQSLVEVALLTPLLLAMLLGAIELGRYAYLSILVANAAHAGALYAAQGPGQAGDTPGIIQAADNDFENNGQNVTVLAVSSQIACGCESGGTIASPLTGSSCSAYSVSQSQADCSVGYWTNMVTVTASAKFHSLFNYPWIPSTLPVTRQSTMQVAN
jgi:Flp pilus assembly protein TadG